MSYGSGRVRVRRPQVRAVGTGMPGFTRRKHHFFTELWRTGFWNYVEYCRMSFECEDITPLYFWKDNAGRFPTLSTMREVCWLGLYQYHRFKSAFINYAVDHYA